MSQTSDSSSRALATLVAALGITIGATPATLHAQAPTNAPAPQATQLKKDAKPDAVQGKVGAKDAVQIKVGAPARDALQQKGKAQSEGGDDEPEVATRKAPTAEKAAVQIKGALQAKAPAAAPAKPM